MVKTFHDLDLKEACIQAAREVIAEQGIEGLSLRDVARKLGVSHQAPYRHYPSRDHLLAAIMQRCFEDFANYLDQASQAHTSDALLSMGEAYMRYAAQHPLEYRLMFGTPWPEPAAHPELVRHAVHAFDLLRSHLLQHLQQRASAPARHKATCWPSWPKRSCKPSSSGRPCTAWPAFSTPTSCSTWCSPPACQHRPNPI